MLNEQIRELQDQLNLLISQGAAAGELYDMSIRLDKLIIRSYLDKKADEVKP